jgi:hypothetical protein
MYCCEIGDGDVRNIGVFLIGSMLITLCMMSGCTNNNSNNSAQIDSDGDGYNDAVDAFPQNSTEWVDSDGDGVGDNTDAFPLDATETRDSDGDGVGDNSDAFPLDANETRDSDGDGVGDHADAFPNNPTEWRDTDGDGVGDNADYYPTDPTRWEQPTTDPFLQEVEPYLDMVALDDNTLQFYADSIINGISGKECQVNAVYRDVLMNYTCLAGHLGSRPLQTPHETIQGRQGTCEDLSILLCSLLNNIDIESWLVFTETHVYVLVSGLNTDDLWECAEQSLRHQAEESFGEPLQQEYVDTYVLPSRNMLYVGGELGQTFDDIIDFMSIDYRIQSDQPLHLFVVPTQREFFALRDGDLVNFTHYAKWEVENLTNAEGSIPQLYTYGGIILLNNGTATATVHVDFSFSFQPLFYETYNLQALTTYRLGGTYAVLLDPSLGAYGFPGYDAGISGEKTAVNPLTKEYVTFQ